MGERKHWPDYVCCERTLDVQLIDGRQVRVWFDAKNTSWDNDAIKVLADLLRETDFPNDDSASILDFIAGREGVNAVQIIRSYLGHKQGVMAYVVPF